MSEETEYQVTEVPTPKTFREMMLYKMDRTIAIIGVVILGVIAISEEGSNPVTISAIGALGTYLGVKGAK